MLLIEDDIHFIHATRQPTSNMTSTAWHMCTGLLDILNKIPAVSVPPDRSKLHRTIAVTMKNGVVKQCRGGVDVQSILTSFSTALDRFFSSTYLSNLSADHRRLDMTTVKQSCENLRCKWKMFYLQCNKLWGNLCYTVHNLSNTFVECTYLNPVKLKQCYLRLQHYF